MRNYDARWLTQGGVSRGDEPLTRAGLTGEGQIIGTADTGVDWDSCFFFDPAVPVPVNAVNQRHRKIIAYWVSCFDLLLLIMLPPFFRSLTD
jgi:hypothetical protein